MEAHIAEAGIISGVLIRSEADTYLSWTNWTRRVWNPAKEAAGVTCRFHDLRHSAVSWLQDQGVPAHAAMAYVGHTQATTHAHYAHPDAAGLRLAANRLGEILGA